MIIKTMFKENEMKISLPSALFQRRPLCVLLICLLFTACAYQDRVAPIQLPDEQNGITVGDGLKVSALAFTEEEKTQEAFGFNARKAGLLPVQLTFQNDGSLPASVEPAQTFLIDQENKAWPVSSLERTYQRARGHVDVGDTLAGTGKPAVLLGVAGAVAGAAVAIVTGDNVGEAIGKGAAVGGAVGAVIGGSGRYVEAQEQIKVDLADKSLRNETILPGQIAYGVLFFPGMEGEAQGVRELRLALSIGGTAQVVTLSLQ